MHGRSSRFRLLVALAAVAVVGAGAVALADVTVYKNDLSSKAEWKELDKGRGNHCDRSYRPKSEIGRITVTRGAASCTMSPPVAGDDSQPNHIFQVQAKVLSTTPKHLRKKAFVLASVRVGGGSRYELRAFPKTHTFELSRVPDGGGFPVEGTIGDIEGIDKRNKLRIQAIGDQVRAFINGTSVGSVTDANPGQLDGVTVEVGAGTDADTKKNTEATFDDLRLAVPNP